MMDYLVILLIVFVFIGATLYVVSNRKEAVQKINAFLLKVVIEAESLYGEKTGQAKKAYVVFLILNSEFYRNLPPFIKPLISAQLLENLIDKFVGEVFNKLKESNKAIEKLITA